MNIYNIIAIIAAYCAAWVAIDASLEAKFASITQHPARDCRPNDQAVQRLAQFLQFQTISDSHSDDHIKSGHHAAFTSLLAFLREQYPEVHSQLQVEEVGLGGWSRLITWQGSDPQLKPILYISHYDVVPVTPGTEPLWSHGPFNGSVADGFLWGRGALDVKLGVIGLLEAVTRLLARGWTPHRTIMLSFGHDEEVGGSGGAGEVAALLKTRGVQLECVVDEGGVVLLDGLKGLVAQPIALVGTAEKLYTSLHVDLVSPGGHSSMPPTDGSDIAGQAARLITRLNAHPFPARLREPLPSFLAAIAPYAPRIVRPLMAYSHVQPLSWVLAQLLVRSGPELAALVRTTHALTRMEAGVADNVLPNTGRLTLNLRSHPGRSARGAARGQATTQPCVRDLYSSRTAVLDHVTAALKAAGVHGATLSISNASHIGPPGHVTASNTTYFEALRQAVQEHWRYADKAVAVAPFLMSGGTDSKHFADLTEHGILRFVPVSVNKTAGELGSVHSTNERMRVADVKLMVCTYARMMELMAGAPGSPPS
ncbi:hypothetical protein QJQ45_027618 [Haematococcus lacustris]|nr:hypothetical protein QJQ45_027618 [Haematococcus lacustris]